MIDETFRRNMADETVVMFMDTMLHDPKFRNAIRHIIHRMDEDDFIEYFPPPDATAGKIKFDLDIDQEVSALRNEFRKKVDEQDRDEQ